MVRYKDKSLKKKQKCLMLSCISYHLSKEITRHELKRHRVIAKILVLYSGNNEIENALSPPYIRIQIFSFQLIYKNLLGCVKSFHILDCRDNFYSSFSIEELSYKSRET